MVNGRVLEIALFYSTTSFIHPVMHTFIQALFYEEVDLFKHIMMHASRYLAQRHLTCKVEDLGIEPLTFLLVDDLL